MLGSLQNIYPLNSIEKSDQRISSSNRDYQGINEPTQSLREKRVRKPNSLYADFEQHKRDKNNGNSSPVLGKRKKNPSSDVEENVPNGLSSSFNGLDSNFTDSINSSQSGVSNKNRIVTPVLDPNDQSLENVPGSTTMRIFLISSIGRSCRE